MGPNEYLATCLKAADDHHKEATSHCDDSICAAAAQDKYAAEYQKCVEQTTARYH